MFIHVFGHIFVCNSHCTYGHKPKDTYMSLGHLWKKSRSLSFCCQQHVRGWVVNGEYLSYWHSCGLPLCSPRAPPQHSTDITYRTDWVCRWRVWAPCVVYIFGDAKYTLMHSFHLFINSNLWSFCQAKSPSCSSIPNGIHNCPDSEHLSWLKVCSLRVYNSGNVQQQEIFVC